MHQPGGLDYVTNATTAVDGSFGVQVPPGRYFVRFSGHSENRQSTTVDDVQVVALSTTRVDVTMPALGVVTGRVIGVGGLPGNFCAYAWRHDGYGWEHGDTTCADPTGGYRLDGLEPGRYRIQFYSVGGTHQIQWWEGARHRPGSTPVEVGLDDVVPGVDAVMAPTSHMRGRVTTEVGAFDVFAWAHAGGTWSIVSTGYRPNGTSGAAYRLRGLAPGRYKVQFRPRDLPQEWWNDARTRDAAEWVHVQAGGTVSGIDASLDESARIDGTIRVRRSSGTYPVEYASVGAYRLVDGAWTLEKFGQSDHTGRYEVDSLPAGRYKVLAASSITGEYPPRWFGDTPDRAGATELTVGMGDRQQGIDITLVPGSIISGTVSRPSGNPIPDARVTVHLREDGEWQELYSQETDEDGLYYLDWLRPGTYRVEFDTDGQWVTEWWDDGTSLATATDVVVGEHEVMSRPPRARGPRRTRPSPTSGSGTVCRCPARPLTG